MNAPINSHVEEKSFDESEMIDYNRDYQNGDSTEQNESVDQLEEKNPRGLDLIEYEENSEYRQPFHMKQFLLTLYIHLIFFIFGPISTVFNIRIFGETLMRNMHYIPKNKYYLEEPATWGFSIWVLVLYLAYDYEIQQEYFGSVIAWSTAIMVRTFLIAVKYGLMSKQQWKNFNEKLMTLREFFDELLIIGWLYLPDNILHSEVIKAVNANKESKNNVLTFEQPFSCNWRAAVSTDENHVETRSDIDECRQIPYQTFASIVIRQVSMTTKLKGQTFIKYWAIIYCLMPIGLRIYGFGWSTFRIDVFEWLLMFFCIVNSWWFSRTYLLWIYVGTVDFKRKLILMANCSAIISNSDLKYLVLDKSLSKLDMNDSETILSWHLLRNTFLIFGKRFTARIFAYAGLMLPVCLAIVLILILQLANVISQENNFYAVNLLFLWVITLSTLVKMSFYAVKLNSYYDIHKDLLLRIQGDLLNQINKENTSKPMKELCRAKSSLKQVIQQLDQDCILRPIKIMGIRMDFAFAAKIGAALASGVLAIISIYLRS